MLDMPMYQFYVNMLAVDDGWIKVFAFSKFLLSDIADFNTPRVYGLDYYKGYQGQKHLLQRAGWHFTFLGGPERVRDKLSAYSHTDDWQMRMIKEGGIEHQILELRDVGGGGRLRYCDIDESFPEILRKNFAHYVKVGFIKPAAERVKDLEKLVGRHEIDMQQKRALEARLRYLEEERICIRNLDATPKLNLALESHRRRVRLHRGLIRPLRKSMLLAQTTAFSPAAPASILRAKSAPGGKLISALFATSLKSESSIDRIKPLG